MKKSKNTTVFANEKGCALLAAIDAGMVPEAKGGYDTAQFEIFWNQYTRNLAELYTSVKASQKGE